MTCNICCKAQLATWRKMHNRAMRHWHFLKIAMQQCGLSSTPRVPPPPPVPFIILLSPGFPLSSPIIITLSAVGRDRGDKLMISPLCNYRNRAPTPSQPPSLLTVIFNQPFHSSLLLTLIFFLILSQFHLLYPLFWLALCPGGDFSWRQGAPTTDLSLRRMPRGPLRTSNTSGLV